MTNGTIPTNPDKNISQNPAISGGEKNLNIKPASAEIRPGTPPAVEAPQTPQTITPIPGQVNTLMPSTPDQVAKIAEAESKLNKVSTVGGTSTQETIVATNITSKLAQEIENNPTITPAELANITRALAKVNQTNRPKLT